MMNAETAFETKTEPGTGLGARIKAITIIVSCGVLRMWVSNVRSHVGQHDEL